MYQLKTRLKGELESQQLPPLPPFSSTLPNEYHHRNAKQVIEVISENYKIIIVTLLLYRIIKEDLIDNEMINE